MKDFRRFFTGIFAILGMILLILDTETSISGAQAGVELCLKVLIPSLFPFFILSALAANTFAGANIPLLRPVSRLCGIPKGGEAFFVLGLIGGYPVGAKNITEAYEQGLLSKTQAQHLLAFCSNAGPAFIFGMAASIFASPLVPWLLWLIHILSAICVGAIRRKQPAGFCSPQKAKPLCIPDALGQSIAAMAGVCGWVVIFRVLLAFAEKWLFQYLADPTIFLISGILELSNGIVSLSALPNDGLRFLLCAGMLSFGGICVIMQTASVIKPLDIRSYLFGKALQSIISLLLAFPIQYFIFGGSWRIAVNSTFWVVFCIFLCTIIVTLYWMRTRRKKVVAIS